MATIECLRDCNAACCRVHPRMRLFFDFSPNEVNLFAQNGMILRETADGYIMPKDCVFLEGSRCQLHDKPEQPRCCVENLKGEELCRDLRKQVSSTALSNVE